MMIHQLVARHTVWLFLLGLSSILGQAGGDPAAKGTPQRQQAHWKLAGIGELDASDKTPLFFKSYKSSDGNSVTLLHGKFASLESAQAELDFQKRHTKEVILYEPKKDVLGGTIDQRLVAITDEQGSQKELAAVFWTKGADLYAALSPSLEVALEWEQK